MYEYINLFNLPQLNISYTRGILCLFIHPCTCRTIPGTQEVIVLAIMSAPIINPHPNALQLPHRGQKSENRISRISCQQGYNFDSSDLSNLQEFRDVQEWWCSGSGFALLTTVITSYSFLRLHSSLVLSSFRSCKKLWLRKWLLKISQFGCCCPLR